MQRAAGKPPRGPSHFEYPELHAFASTKAKLSGHVLEGSHVIIVENPVLRGGASTVRLKVSLHP